MQISDATYQWVGEVLWHARWRAIVEINSEGAVTTTLARDMNGDGVLSISDVSLWIQWAFWLPGDYLLIGIWRVAPEVAVFLELTPAHLGGWVSGIVSAAIICIGIGYLLVALDAVLGFVRDIRTNGLFP